MDANSPAKPVSRRATLTMLAAATAGAMGATAARGQGVRPGLAGLVEMPELIMPGGRSVKATLMLPARLPAPAVVLVHDRWGADNSVYDRTQALVADRYVALMVDYMDGATPGDDAAAAAALKKLSREDALDTTVAWLNWLTADARVNRQLAVVGWGVGGALALDAARRLPLRAAVLYYPDFARPPNALERVSCPLLAHFSARDDLNSAQLQSALAQSRRTDRVFSYAAERDFADSTRPAFNRSEAALAWNRSVAFLRASLGKPPD